MSARTPADELLDVMPRLADLLGRETALLGAGRIADIAPLQSEKLRLLRDYQAAMKVLDPTAAPTWRAQLGAASLRLAQAAGENERALRIGRAATQRLIGMVVDSIKARRSGPCAYGAGRAPARPAPMLAIALDRRA